MRHQVFYHAHCVDGSAAMAVMLHAFKDMNLSEHSILNHTPVSHAAGESLLKFKDHVKDPTLSLADVIWFLDYCPKNEVLEELCETSMVIVVDHHKTVLDQFETLEADTKWAKNLYTFISEGSTSSGASTAYATVPKIMEMLNQGELFKLTGPQSNPPEGYGEVYRTTIDMLCVQGLTDTSHVTNIDNMFFEDTIELPYFIDLVRTRDIWDKRIPDVKFDADNLSAGIRLIGGVEDPKLLVDCLDSPCHDIMSQGKAYEDNRKADARKVIENGTKFRIFTDLEHLINIVVTEEGIDNASNIGEQWSIPGTFTLAVIVDRTEDNKLSVSLRSSPNVDASRIAKHFGGGGHIQACGFRTELSIDTLTLAILRLAVEWF